MVNLPLERDDQVDINVAEIAAMREHTVVSYSYQKWTRIILKNGEKFECTRPLDEVRNKIERVVREVAGVDG